MILAHLKASLTCTKEESTNSTSSLTVNPGVMTGQPTGMKAIRMVGIANTREKRKVNFHLRMDFWWLTPESLESADTTRAVNPAP